MEISNVSIAHYLQERDQEAEIRAANQSPKSPTTSRINVGHPKDPPENSQKKKWKKGNDGKWYNSDVCLDEVDEEEIGNEDPSDEEETKK